MSASIESSPTACSTILTPQDWHRRLGHPSVEVNKHLLSLFGFNKVSNVTSCESCSVSKSHKLPFSLSYNAALLPFQLIHSDVGALRRSHPLAVFGITLALLMTLQNFPGCIP